MDTPETAINYEVAQRDLRYYIFDWDDNILHMPTRIYLERRLDDGTWVAHPVSTATFAMVRNDTERFRPQNGDWEYACRDFRDNEISNENIFLRDTRSAIDRVVKGEAPAAPSFRRFRQALIEGRLFAIVTARGHEPEVIRRGVEYFIAKVLSDADKRTMTANLRGYLACFAPQFLRGTEEDVLDYYLSHNRYHGVRSPHFRELAGRHGVNAESTEEGKQFAIRDFVQHVIDTLHERGLQGPVSFGFSDDDPANAQAVEDYIRDKLGPEFPSVKFVVYYVDPSDASAGRKIEVRGQLNLPL